MNRQEAILELQNKGNLTDAEKIALDGLIAWDLVIMELQDKIEFTRKCHAKDYSLGMDAALYIIQTHLQDDNIII